MQDPLVATIMTRSPVAVAPAASVAAASRLMREHGFHHLPVVENGVLVGLLSASDVIKALVPVPGAVLPAGGPALLEARPVAAIMTRRVHSVPQNATLEDAARALAAGGFHALPVVAPGNVLAGIITASDLADQLLQALATPADIPAAPVVAGSPACREAALRSLYQAVRHYLASGRGEIEHGRLQLAFDAAREQLEPDQLTPQV